MDSNARSGGSFAPHASVTGMKPQSLAKPQLARYLRSRLDSHLYDDSRTAARGTAIYALCDPRDASEIRYVGQSAKPRRRLLQHLSTARLWLPDEIPWWVDSPKLRPLYEWIRTLYRSDGRLPVMVISQWVATTRDARLAERNRIFECLERHAPLLNIEAALLGRQIPLL